MADANNSMQNVMAEGTAQNDAVKNNTSAQLANKDAATNEKVSESQVQQEATEEKQFEPIRDPEGLKRTLDKVRAEAREKERMISELKKQLIALEGKLAGLSEDAIRAKQLEEEAQILRDAIREKDEELSRFRAEVVKSRAINLAVSSIRQRGVTINHEAFIAAVNRLPLSVSDISEDSLAEAISMLANAFIIKSPSPQAPALVSNTQGDPLSSINSPLAEALRQISKFPNR